VVTRILAGKRWRWARMGAGIVIMLTGGVVIGGVPGAVVTMVFGYVPFVESLYDVNLVAPLLRRPFSAQRLRERAAQT
jgi:hypothetical protein